MPKMYSEECQEGVDVPEAQMPAFEAAGWGVEVTKKAPAPAPKKAAAAAKKAKEADV